MYKLRKNGDGIIRLSDNALIPIAVGNIDYKAYLEWVTSGGTVNPAQTQDEIDAEAIASRNADIMDRIDRKELKLIRQLAKNDTVKIAALKADIIDLLNKLTPPGNW